MVYGGQSLLAAAMVLGTSARTIIRAYQLPDPDGDPDAPPPAEVTSYLAPARYLMVLLAMLFDLASSSSRRIVSWGHFSMSSLPSRATFPMLPLTDIFPPGMSVPATLLVHRCGTRASSAPLARSPRARRAPVVLLLQDLLQHVVRRMHLSSVDMLRRDLGTTIGSQDSMFQPGSELVPTGAGHTLNVFWASQFGASLRDVCLAVQSFMPCSPHLLYYVCLVSSGTMAASDDSCSVSCGCGNALFPASLVLVQW